jgi:hypothetical protein
VISEAGIGTTVFINLPASGNGASARREKGNHPTEMTGKVHLMDDEETIRDMAGQMLHPLGHQGEFARDGDEAVELFCQARDSGAPFDVVIMDLTNRGGRGSASQ